MRQLNPCKQKKASIRKLDAFLTLTYFSGTRVRDTYTTFIECSDLNLHYRQVAQGVC